MKRLMMLILTVCMLTLTLAACAKETMDSAESAMENVSSKLSSEMSGMLDSTVSATSAPTARSFSTDNPTDGDLGEPNVNDYDDNDSNAVGDESEAGSIMDNATENQ